MSFPHFSRRLFSFVLSNRLIVFPFPTSCIPFYFLSVSASLQNTSLQNGKRINLPWVQIYEYFKVFDEVGYRLSRAQQPEDLAIGHVDTGFLGFTPSLCKSWDGSQAPSCRCMLLIQFSLFKFINVIPLLWTPSNYATSQITSSTFLIIK
jgi:hypothetical protein